jgi:Zn-dependent protease
MAFENSIQAQEADAELLLARVRSVMAVDDQTLGGRGQPFALRYRGRLIVPSDQAFENLNPAFASAGMTLLMRREHGQDVVLAMPGVINPSRSNPWINLILFLLTLVSVMLAGVMYGYQGPAPANLGDFLLAMLRAWPQGIPFAASMLAILLAHEFGHYLAARYHKTAVTLPYFLPFPGSPFGTLGAFIQLKQPPRDRRALLDIGLAGPLAGMVVAVPLLLWGLSMSPLGSLPMSPDQAGGAVVEGNSILYLASKWLVLGKLLPAPLSYGGMSPALYWLRYFFLGLPAPLGAQDVLLSPVAWAGWAGLLVTALNLIPAGQLDGGHVLYVLLKEKAGKLLPFLVVGLLLLGVVWPGWWLWAALVFFLGRTHAVPLNEIVDLDRTRRWLAVLGLVIFVLTFTPVPLRALLGA